MRYSLDEIQRRVRDGVFAYNAGVPADERIARVQLFGSYAQGRARDDSDVDLLVSFASPVVSLFTLARALEAMESQFETSVDVVQDPLPSDALLDVREQVPLYEAA